MSLATPIRIGTRGSALALAQAAIVAETLGRHGIAHEVVVVETEGDRRAPDTAWGEGAFVTAIEKALADGRVDVAVHSAKDIPTDEDPALSIAAYLPREDASDALVLPSGSSSAGARSLDDLPAGSVIGTDSPRRTGFLRAVRPDLDVQPLHGNVDTRLRRLDEGTADALILASAGLIRLGRQERITQRLPVEQVPPAPGQGAIAVQVRAGDHSTAAVLAYVDHKPTRLAVEAERAFLHATGGGCRAPIGAFATIAGDQLSMICGFAAVDGSSSSFEHVAGLAGQSIQLARDAAARLVARRAGMVGGARFVVTRPKAEADEMVASLAEHGLIGVAVPAIEIEPVAAGRELDQLISHIAEFDWTIVTSVNGARAVLAAADRTGADLSRTRWAAVGRVTASVLRGAGVVRIWMPSRASGEALGDELPLDPGELTLVARGSLADDRLPRRLRERGAEVTEAVAYETREAPASSRDLLSNAITAGPLAGVILASPSAVRGILALAGTEYGATVLAATAVCIGPSTADAAREAGFGTVVQAEHQSASAVARLAAASVS